MRRRRSGANFDRRAEEAQRRSTGRCRGDICVQSRRASGRRRRGGDRGDQRGHQALRRDDRTGCAAAACRASTWRRQTSNHVGGQLARLQQHQFREAARLVRYPEHLHAALLRSRLGRAGLSAAGHRAHRSHPRTRRDALGIERRQWRDQHHDQERAQTRRASTPRREVGTRGRHAAAGATADESATSGYYRVFGQYSSIATRTFRPSAIHVG